MLTRLDARDGRVAGPHPLGELWVSPSSARRVITNRAIPSYGARRSCAAGNRDRDVYDAEHRLQKFRLAWAGVSMRDNLPVLISVSAV